MIQITAAAQQHFRRMLAQQGVDGAGIRIQVIDAGTPAANCELEFCETEDLTGTEHRVDCEGFVLYVVADSADWLLDARIDYEQQRAGGQLNIVAPRIRGELPAADAGVLARVRYVIASEINPQLAAHHGHVELLEVDADGIAVLRFGGGCHGCGMVDVTLKQGVEKTLCLRVPEIAGVRDSTEHAKGENPYYRKRDGASAIG
ncbi:MAG TPA: NfuA family Fe-S biogenesis protein [Rhodanobacteraceae bacterium]|nr:NfuA family Fe-S biogenesis protein [Rhodanobacteraceae bacterium]